MATKSNLLKMSDVKKKAKESQIQETYTLHDDTVLKFYPIFSETKIEELMIDLQLLLKESELKQIEITDSLMYHLINLMTIKHFSHLGKFIKGGVLEHIEYLDALRNGGYYKEIIDVFLPSEKQKIYEALSDKIAENQVFENILSKVAERTQELKLKNEDLFKQIDSLGKTQKQVKQRR
ncbi:hypothetical protein NST17_19815 [Caldifermentibacillus hisashii]|uniref:DUF4375 domain-containing protein n=1 Tax=Caldifermentibacillus hisashii TaxID=996558 RepID=A0ABU9K4L5_9BACI